MQHSLPGVTDCQLTSMEEGSVVVGYEVKINTATAAQQIASDPSFANVNLDSVLEDSGSLVGDVLADASFVSGVMDQVSTARANAGKAAIEVMPSDPNDCPVGVTGCPFIPSATVKPIDYAIVFADTCSSNCAAGEVLYHAS